MTYIYDDEKANAVNVAIACRGTDITKCIDLWQDVTMIWRPDTDSDKVAKEYADKILKKIVEEYIVKQMHKYKEINVIFLGHSKGGREAQKQMLAIYENPIFIKKKILFEYKYKEECIGDCPCKCEEYWQDNCSKNKDCKCNKLVNINTCCLTFNSAPCSKEDNKKHPKEIKDCQNLIVFDKVNLAADPLSYIKYIVFSLIILIISLMIIKKFIIKDKCVLPIEILEFCVKEGMFLLISYILIISFLVCLKIFFRVMNFGIIAFAILISTLFTTISATFELAQTNPNIVVDLFHMMLQLLLLFLIYNKTVRLGLGKNSGNNCGYKVHFTDLFFQAHFMGEFTSPNSRYKDLEETDISKIIKAKNWQDDLEALAEEGRKKRETSVNQYAKK